MAENSTIQGGASSSAIGTGSSLKETQKRAEVNNMSIPPPKDYENMKVQPSIMMEGGGGIPTYNSNNKENDKLLIN